MEDKDMRNIYCDALCDLASRNDDVVVLDADLAGANGTAAFGKKFPERFINAGVAEANMVGIASGLAAGGMIPYASSFACFAARRAFDQFFISSNYAKCKVNLVGTDPGISAQYNGGTHMAFEDVGLMRSVPGLVVYEPSDIVSLYSLVQSAADIHQSTYMRLHRKGTARHYDEGEKFEFGRGKVLRDGDDITIIATGFIMVPEALTAAESLKKAGISAAVIDMHTIKPIDEELVISYADKTGAVLTCENHQTATGMGAAVAAVLAEKKPVQVYCHGVRDEFGEVGDLEYLKARYGFNAETITSLARKMVGGR